MPCDPARIRALSTVPATARQGAPPLAGRLRRSLWLAAGLVCLGLGFVGAFLPVLPTTPFVLLAAFCFARSSARLLAWLHRNRLMGPMVRDWQAEGVVRPRAKLAATVMIVLLCGYTVAYVPLALWLKALVATVCGSVLVFIWSRPSRPRAAVAAETAADTPWSGTPDRATEP